MLEYLQTDVVPVHEAIIRCVMALAFGMMIGFERDSKKKPIDFRAYMIVALTTCIIALLGQELYENYNNGHNSLATLDLGKIIEGVMTGIGFLGAGAIIKVEKDKVVGTATGASIWASGGIGLCLGFGMYGLALIAFIGIAAILFIGGIVGHFFVGDQRKEKSKLVEDTTE